MQQIQPFPDLAPVLRPAAPIVEFNAPGAMLASEHDARLPGSLRRAAVASVTALALAACGGPKPTLGNAEHGDTIELPKDTVVLFYEVEGSEKCKGGQGGGEAAVGSIAVSSTTRPVRPRRPAASPSASKKKATIPRTCEGAEVQLVACQNNGAPNPSVSAATIPEFTPQPGSTYAYYPNSCNIVDVKLDDFPKIFGAHDQLEQGTPLTSKKKFKVTVDKD